MKITRTNLRHLINEELLHEFFGIDVKKQTHDALASYFRDNADGIADKVIPNIPFDGEIVERYFEQVLADSIRENSDLMANCILEFFNPLAAVHAAKGKSAKA